MRYKNAVRQAELILEGKTIQLKDELNKRMANAAEELRYELAAEIRDRIAAITSLEKRQTVIAAVFADTDAVGFFRGAVSCFAVLHYTEGDLSGKDYELIDEPLESDCEAVSEFVMLYYSSRGAWPKVILLPFEIDDKESMEKMISEAAGRKVGIQTPKRGDLIKLVGNATVNAREESLRAVSLAERRLRTLEWLQKTLGMPKLPERIEAFDVSNIGNFGVVAAMTVFIRGKPLKKDYRKFRIREVTGQDDYHSMQEAVSRRFKRMTEKDEKFADVPDLLLIDGGGTHASAAKKVLADLDLDIPVFGMVKDEKHRTRALVSPGGDEIGLTGNPAAFALIGNIQEETHRFAIEYHRSLRSAGIGTKLDKIPGVGETRRNELLKHFKTIKAIKEASIEQLCSVCPKKHGEIRLHLLP
jgi:excinuclease ABC subunit C